MIVMFDCNLLEKKTSYYHRQNSLSLGPVVIELTPNQLCCLLKVRKDTIRPIHQPEVK